MGITNKEEFNLNDSSISFEDVIDGLNKYFAEDETRVRVPRSIVEIRSHNKILFYRFDAEMYLDKLIAWLRTEHGIFYYPGMEAKYAKTERIPPFTERMMDEGALNSLKKLYKRVTGEEPEVDSHTLIAYGITEAVAESLSRNAEKSDINQLISDYCNKFDIIAPSPDSSDKACVEYLFSVVDLERQHRAAVGKQMVDDYKKDIMDRIRQEASLYSLNLPEKVDGEPLTIERVFHDLLELMRMRGEELRTLESKCNRLNEIAEELNTLNNEIKEDLP